MKISLKEDAIFIAQNMRKIVDGSNSLTAQSALSILISSLSKDIEHSSWYFQIEKNYFKNKLKKQISDILIAILFLKYTFLIYNVYWWIKKLILAQ